MSTETYTFHASERDGGFVSITSPDLPGFRLLLEEGADIPTEINRALKVFYPVYKAARAKRLAEFAQPELGQKRPHPSGSGFDISARMAFA